MFDNSEDELIENFMKREIQAEKEKPNFPDHLNLEENDSDEKSTDILKGKANKDIKTQLKLDSSNPNILNNFSSQNIQNSTLSQISRYRLWRKKNTYSIKSLKNLTKTFETIKDKTLGTFKTKSEKESESKDDDELEKNANLNQIENYKSDGEGKNKEKDEIFANFDQICAFKNYFPLNNYQIVLLKFNKQINRKKLKKIAPIHSQNLTKLTHLSILKNKIKFVLKNEKNKRATKKKKTQFSETSILNDQKSETKK